MQLEHRMRLTDVELKALCTALRLAQKASIQIGPAAREVLQLAPYEHDIWRILEPVDGRADAAFVVQHAGLDLPQLEVFHQLLYRLVDALNERQKDPKKMVDQVQVAQHIVSWAMQGLEGATSPR